MLAALEEQRASVSQAVELNMGQDQETMPPAEANHSPIIPQVWSLQPLHEVSEPLTQAGTCCEAVADAGHIGGAESIYFSGHWARCGARPRNNASNKGKHLVIIPQVWSLQPLYEVPKPITQPGMRQIVVKQQHMLAALEERRAFASHSIEVSIEQKLESV